MRRNLGIVVGALLVLVLVSEAIGAPPGVPGRGGGPPDHACQGAWFPLKYTVLATKAR